MIFPSEEYNDAVSAACHGTLTDEQADALNVLLRSDVAAIDEYLWRVDLHAVLAASPALFEADVLAGAPVARRQSPVPRPPNRSVRRPLAQRNPVRRSPVVVRSNSVRGWLAAMLVLCVAGGWLFWRNHSPARTMVATLAQTVEARWERGVAADKWKTGDIARVASGRVRFDFENGARLVLEGPAELEFLARDAARLRHGTAVCEIGERGYGFRIEAGGLTATDLGTAFGVKAPPGGAPEIHVLAGRVSVAEKSGVRREISDGFAVQQSGSGLADVALARSSFASASRLLPDLAARAKSRTHDWAAVAQQLATDADTVLYHPFRVRGKVLAPMRGTDALIENAEPTTAGRWPGEAALIFRGDADRATGMLEDSFDSLTLLAWVRVDALPKANGGLLIGLAARNGDDTGIIHWGLSSNGTLTFARNRGPQRLAALAGWDTVKASQLVTPAALGEWLLLTTTADARTGEVVHYLNGREAVREKLKPGAGTFRLGRFGIGNSVSGPGYGLHGAIAELLVARRAYPAEEMARQYATGHP